MLLVFDTESMFNLEKASTIPVVAGSGFTAF